MPSWKIVAGWVVVVLATTFLAWQIVSLADSQVSATPVEIVTPTSAPPTTATSSTLAGSSPSTSPPTTAPVTTSSSTPSPDPDDIGWSVRTITSAGGTVIIRHRPGVVELQAATPVPGFVMEIDDNGPDRVRVEFENDSQDVRVEVRPGPNGLQIEID